MSTAEFAIRAMRIDTARQMRPFVKDRWILETIFGWPYQAAWRFSDEDAAKCLDKVIE